MTGTGAASGCRKQPAAVTGGHLTRADVTLPVGAAFEGVVRGPERQAGGRRGRRRSSRTRTKATTSPSPTRAVTTWRGASAVAPGECASTRLALRCAVCPPARCQAASSTVARSVSRRARSGTASTSTCSRRVRWRLPRCGLTARRCGTPRSTSSRLTDSNFFGFGYTNAHGEFLESRAAGRQVLRLRDERASVRRGRFGRGIGHEVYQRRPGQDRHPRLHQAGDRPSPLPARSGGRCTTRMDGPSPASTRWC